MTETGEPAGHDHTPEGEAVEREMPDPDEASGGTMGREPDDDERNDGESAA
jgi:hypothetical protein